MDYESDDTLAEYLLLHYGDSGDLLNGLPGPLEAVGFPTRAVRALLDLGQLSLSAQALEVGCAVGASTFELARYCSTVVGVDVSQKFISAASTLANYGELNTYKKIEGKLTEPFIARVPRDIPRNRVHFCVADALSLNMHTSFNLVLAFNLLCRLPVPQQFLKSLPLLVRPGGQLLLTTPFSWVETFTQKEFWLGGKDSQDQSGWETLKKLLAPHFELKMTQNLPFFIREHARKFQYGISLGSRWIRK